MNIVYDEGSKLPRRLASPEAGFPIETLSGNIVNRGNLPPIAKISFVLRASSITLRGLQMAFGYCFQRILGRASGQPPL